VSTKKTLYVLTARDNKLARTRKSVEMSWLKKYSKNSQSGLYEGGIEDIGDFREGHCFKLQF
jgi:hypothetical protein